MNAVTRLAVFLCASALASSCGADRRGTDSASNTDPSATFQAVTRVSSSDTQLGLSIFRVVIRDLPKDQNAIVSPWGLGRAMDILYNAADGQTKADMSRALHLDELDLGAVNAANLWLGRNLRSSAGGISAQIADALWYADDLQLNPDFAKRVADNFGVQAQSLDFGRPEAAARIDEWVRAHSQGDGMRYSAPVDKQTRALLVDILTLDALWNKHFDPALTRPHSFRAATGRRTTVPMMKMTDSFPYRHANGFQVVGIPYHGFLSMDILLPDDPSEGMNSVESVLSVIPLSNLLDGAPHTPGTVEIPRFDVKFSGDLETPISQVGLGSIFSSGFPGMWVHDDYPVERVVQQCYVNVDEWGTRAGSATSLTIQSLIKPRPPFTFVADHPFIFLIRDNEMGTVLFAGLVNDLP